jgi:integrase
MARTVRDAKLESRTARAALKPSGKPYFRSIDEGLHLGYRKGKTTGKWVMRRYVTGRYLLELIGTADDTLDADGTAILSFPQAQAAARHRFVEAKRVAAGQPAVSGPYTVKDAVREYLAWMEENRKTARDARWRAEALILPDLGAVPCAKLTTQRIREWRDKSASTAPRLRVKKGEGPRRRAASVDDDVDEVIRRRKATANRTLTILKAALNHAWRDQKIPTDAAWRPVTGFREADAARVRYLTIAEAQRLINASDPDFRSLVQAALQSGARYSELAALTVGDFNPDSGTLHIRVSKSGKGRHVVLTEEGVAFFKELAVGRSSQDRILPKEDGGRWLKSHQSRPMLDACKGAKIEPPANFHVLRHTYASLIIMNGAPLMVVAKNLGHSDTRMVEKHYGHLAPSFVADAIRAAAPRFGTTTDTTVASTTVTS